MGTVPNSGALPTAPVDTAPHLRPPLRVATVLAAVVATLGLATLGTWLGGERSVPSEATKRTQALTPSATVSFEPHVIEGVESQLVRAGYSITVDGELDPVAKSALADYLRPTRGEPLNLFLAARLEGTVITGLRNPVAWNNRFGLNRRARLVERPLTGPDGQLDQYGNIVQR